MSDIAAPIFAGSGEMAARCRAFDWAATPLGPVSQWPQSLRTIVATMLESRHPMFLWWGPELIQIFNDGYLPSFGTSGRDLVALGARGQEHWVDIWPVISPQIEQVMTRGEATWHEDQFIPIERNGRLEDVWWTYGYSPVRDDNGVIAGVLVVVQETTTRVQAVAGRDRLLSSERAARAEAEAANRTKSDFLAVMSHELRTPLNAIAGHIQLIELGIHGPVTPQQLEALGRVARAQHHLLGLINDVLNFAKLESGTVVYDLEPVALVDVIADAAAMIERQMESRGLTFVAKLPERTVMALADREKLLQVLINLLSNGMKFTPPGGQVDIGVSVHADASAGADRVCVHVTDTGVGIAPEKLISVFDPFVQVSATSAVRREGTGLGLAISRDLARGMQGELQVQSTLGFGSIFTLTLQPALSL